MAAHDELPPWPDLRFPQRLCCVTAFCSHSARSDGRARVAAGGRGGTDEIQQVELLKFCLHVIILLVRQVWVRFTDNVWNENIVYVQLAWWTRCVTSVCTLKHYS